MATGLTGPQRDRLRDLCARYGVAFRESDYVAAFDLPQGWVSGWVGGADHGETGPGKQTLFVGVSPDGDAHS